MSALTIRFGRGVSQLPADIALALIPSLPRPHLERLVQTLIDRMDEADGDTDLEPEETDHTGGEDDFSGSHHDGPGCPISDPGSGYDEDIEYNGDELERDVTPAGWFG
ncbi:hypothetical protein GCM10009115_09220 [Sphingopyxis soli]|uniref:Uncharacterized protein n=1 Tax=Sphingopyxis soli TaxID=592051 RepID=A0ABN1LZP9_9SPHN|nr:hypothetical protein [Sphingopyxis soli]